MLGRADRDEGKLDLGPLQPLGRVGGDVALFQLDLRAHGRQGHQVQVDRAGADGAAAGQRDLGLARAGQQRPQDVERGPHLTNQIIGGEGRGQLGRVEQGLLTVGAVALRHLDPELAQQLPQELGVGQARHVGQQQGLIRQDRSRHQLDGRILGAADLDLAVQAVAAVDDDAVHGIFRGRKHCAPANRLSSKPLRPRERAVRDDFQLRSAAGRGAAPGALRRFRFVRRAAARRTARSALAFCSRVCSTTVAAGTASFGGVSMLCSRARAKFLIKHAFSACAAPKSLAIRPLSSLRAAVAQW